MRCAVLLILVNFISHSHADDLASSFAIKTKGFTSESAARVDNELVASSTAFVLFGKELEAQAGRSDLEGTTIGSLARPSALTKMSNSLTAIPVAILQNKGEFAKTNLAKQLLQPQWKTNHQALRGSEVRTILRAAEPGDRTGSGTDQDGPAVPFKLPETPKLDGLKLPEFKLPSKPSDLEGIPLALLVLGVTIGPAYLVGIYIISITLPK